MNALTNSTATAGGEEPRRIFYRGQPVMTTEQLAAAYEVSSKNINDNHQNHSSRFHEGDHFFRLTGAELKAFKSFPDNIGVADKFAPQIILWTEHGALRHAKVLDSPKAWEVFERLEESYFAMRAGASALPAGDASAKEVRLTMAHNLKLMKMAGFEGSRALIAANLATARLTGFDNLEALGIPRLHDTANDILLNPTELGQRLGGLSAQTVNLHLQQLGLQIQEPTHKGKSRWALTEKGKQAGGTYDAGAYSNNMGMYQQARWPLSIVDMLRDFLKGAA